MRSKTEIDHEGTQGDATLRSFYELGGLRQIFPNIKKSFGSYCKNLGQLEAIMPANWCWQAFQRHPSIALCLVQQNYIKKE